MRKQTGIVTAMQKGSIKGDLKGRRKSMTDNDSRQKSPYDVELPQRVIESFARFLLPEIRKFYASEEGQQAFREWEEQQKKYNT
jgi:hypothetical protein